MIPMLAAVEQQGLEVLLYLFLTAALLVVSVVILRLVQDNGYRLILMALLTAAVGIGFDAFLSGIPTLPEMPIMRSGTLMRIAFIAALGGVCTLLLSAKEPPTSTAVKKRKGAKDAE